MNGPRSIVSTLKRISAAGRHAWPPAPGADGTALGEYLYVPAGTHNWVHEVPIVRKTAKWIYYTSDSWGRGAAVVSPGCISREQFETTGAVPVPEDRNRSAAARRFYSTREAAEACLYREERQCSGRLAPPPLLLRQLRRAMADAHPDRGGTAREFMEARRRYQTALRAGQAV